MNRTLPSLILVFVLSCTTAPPQKTDAPPVVEVAPDPLLVQYPELDDALPWDAGVHKGVLANGLSWYVEPRGEPRGRVELWIAVRVGSLQEEGDQLGLAHVVEHMAFNGSKNFQRNELVKYLEGVGVKFGPHLNAHTSFAETVYKLQLPTDDPAVVDKGFVVLADWAQGVSFDPDEIERERGVVLEEWRRGRGVSGRTRDAMMPVVFRGARQAVRLPIGTEESLRTFDHAALERYYRDWYRPELMAVFVVGDVGVEDAKKKIEATFGGLVNPPDAPAHTEYELPIHEETNLGVYADPEQSHTAVSVTSRKRGHKSQTHREYRAEAVFNLVISVLNERLADLIKREPKVLSAGAGRGFADRTTVTESLFAVAADGAAVEAFELAYVEVERLRRHGVTEAELGRARDRALTSMEGAFAERDKETSRGAMGELLRNFTTDETVPGIEAEWAMTQRYLPGVGVAEANAAAATFLPEKARTITCTLPLREGVAVPTDAQFLAAATRVEGGEIAAADAADIQGQLIEVAPTPGKVVYKELVEDPGFHRWTLSNGVVVLLKPTDFDADSVLFEGFEPGGDSLAEDGDLVAAQTAVSIARESGLGGLSAQDLRKWLAGRSVAVGPSIFALRSGVWGSARPADLEVAMQLVYATYTAPRFDSDAFEREKARKIEYLRDRDARPQTRFHDRVDALAWSDHPRRRPMTLERVAEMDLAKSEAFYHARFDDAAGTTFVFTGSFTLESIEPLLETWIASLPAKTPETFVDRGERPAKGRAKDTVRAGIDAKAEVEILYSGTFQSTPENRHALNTLASVLRVRLREELREERGGTYGVQVGATTRFDPVDDYGIVVSFQCDPARVDELLAVAYDVVESVRKRPVDARYTDGIKEQERRGWQTSLRSNGYWKAAIASNAQRAEPPPYLTRFWGLYEKISPAYVHATARKFIDPKRSIEVILLPAAQAPE